MAIYAPNDIESYPNVHTVAGHIMGRDFLFEMSEYHNDWERWLALIALVKERGIVFTFYNGELYDYPTIHHTLRLEANASGMEVAARAYEKTVEIIEKTDWNDRNKHLVYANRRVFPYVDLMKIMGFDQKNRRVSLKQIEFNYRLPDIQPLPFKPGTHLTREQVKVLRHYNLTGDVYATQRLLDECIAMGLLSAREILNEQFPNQDFTNANNTAIGKKLLEEIIGRDNLYYFSDGKRQPKQTILSSVHLGSVIYDYVKFTDQNLVRLLYWLKRQTLRVARGRDHEGSLYSTVQTLSECDYSELADLMGRVYSDTELRKLAMAEVIDQRFEIGLNDYPVIDQSNPSHRGMGAFAKVYSAAKLIGTEKQLLPVGKIDKFNIHYHGLDYVMGVGGIHASRENVHYRSDETHCIVDVDVGGMYVSVAMANGTHPKHIPADIFIPAYGSIPERRAQYPKNGTAKDKSLNLAWKESGNALYGNSNEPNSSPYYDPSYMLEVTINGQLSLLMLIEQLHTHLTDCEIIQANTDGVTFRCLRSEAPRAKQVWQDWEKVTGLVMEPNIYRQMIIKNVSSYIAEDANGKRKYKKDYEYKGLPHNKNHSDLIVRIAAGRILLGDLKRSDLLSFLQGWGDNYDFMQSAKASRGQTLIAKSPSGDYELPSFIRFAIVKSGVELIVRRETTPNERAKNPDVLHRDGYKGGTSGYFICECNDTRKFDRGNLNYDYYISKIDELIKIDAHAAA